MRKSKFGVAGALHAIALGFLFFRYVPWFGSRPISELEGLALSNVPAPDWAKSFSVNHGKAIYFRDSVPSEEPLLYWIAILSFVLVVFSGWYWNRVSK